MAKGHNLVATKQGDLQGQPAYGMQRIKVGMSVAPASSWFYSWADFYFLCNNLDWL